MNYPTPHRDAERVQALRAHRVLDTLPEADYDDLVRLASHICGTPIALISLIDNDRQWFKARLGLDVAETLREHSFCAHAICEPDQEVFEVCDAQLDARFAQNPLVQGDPNIRFYAGTPLITRDGWALGTLCIIDRKPRQLTKEQTDALVTLRRHVVNALELRRLVHEQKHTINALHQTQEELEISRGQAEAATQAKSRFLATMSHEIRTPMNAVIGMATLLQTTPLNAEQQECTETIRTSGEMLLTLINDILDFSKIESGRLDLEQCPFALDYCIDRVIDLVASHARQKDLRLTRELAPGVPPVIVGDEVRLRQIILNLFSNAIKFTQQGGVALRVDSVACPDGRHELHFAVHDTGIGIPPDRIDRLFQLYAQADISTTRNFGGTGLGLAISKRLVEMMGGRMWVKSAEGEGSIFNFTLVAAAGQSAPAAAQVTGKLDPEFAARHPAQILVADDKPVNRKVAMRLLEKLGYHPASAFDGEAALAHVQQQPCDVILMDDEMPGLTGPAATAEIRKLIPAEKQPVIVALTAHALVGDRERYLAAGMDEYLTKPLRVEHLNALLARLPALRAALRSRPHG
jgi:signal transduction histidine kinase/ActR/RegA family two-component response regulator